MQFPSETNSITDLSDNDWFPISDTSDNGKLKKLSIGEFKSLLEGTTDIGTAGSQGFGVGICPAGSLPTGFTALEGTYDITSDNYGNYQFSDGSIMVFVPKFYYRIANEDNSTYATYLLNSIDIKGTSDFNDTSSANASGYALHRAFIDGGEEKDGFFVDKYMCSKNTLGTGYVASSIKNGYPISTSSSHNPIAELTACSGNYYYEAITAAHARDGENGEINSDSIFFCNTRFIQSALALISLAQGQASSNTTYCGWYDSTYNYPKGNNDNALGDTDDTDLEFTSDGYSNCALTGSGVPFNKTTHNGQNCGIADVNGNMWEINLGLTRPGTSATDTTQQDDTSQFFVLKESIKASSLTSGFGTLSTDTWGASAHLIDLYDQIDIEYISNDRTYRFGNGINQVISESLSGDEYKLAGLGFPKDSNAKSSTGTDLYGKDYWREYHRANLTLLSSGYWTYGSNAGVFAALLNYYRSTSYNTVGFRFACYTN